MNYNAYIDDAELRESLHLATLTLNFKSFLTSIRGEISCLNCLKKKDACILLMSQHLPRKTGKEHTGVMILYT